MAVNETTDAANRKEHGIPKINEITMEAPWQWLAAGWQDMRRAYRVSLAYGVFFVFISYVLTLGLIWGGMFYFVPPLVAGYLLVSPILGIGLYSVSRNLEKNEPVSLAGSLVAWRCNETQVAAMGVILMFAMLVWFLMANLTFALFFDQPLPTWENFIPVVFLSGDSPLFLAVGISVGAVIAFFVFAISAVSVPMLMDCRGNALSAVLTSLAAVRKNWKTMLLWAYLLAMFAGAGLLTLYIGLAFAFPLVGHATWHAYRDVVGPDQE